MMTNSDILLGYDYDKWYGYAMKEPVLSDISVNTNSHTLICGMSGSGKSYLTNQLLARLCIQCGENSKVYFSDFKQDDTFSYLRNCKRYYPYDSTTEALNTVYEILHNRQSGKDTLRTPVTLVWDEYIANVLSLISEDKKQAQEVMRKVSEILMLGRSLAVRLVVSCQRPDAVVFPTGSRLNYGIIIIVGAPIKSIYEMLIPKEYIERIGERQFKIGEGVALLQGSELHFIKVPVIRDNDRLQRICIEALNR
ncbi:MAG: hypothetical protein NC213_04075 [Acetobacter sp.]|nr:hypothetical protein [Bacteroides sp.]MCM1340901.1 hypothetical protein [Acetobacter sp.]MCM1432543.1 hypothetical protein [Clostridiales bacterium]